MNQAFSDPMVVHRLLTVCQGEGWIVPRVAHKVRVMIEQGVHPEQALIGTGLISIEAYGEALAQACGVPFVRLPSTPGPSLPNMKDEVWQAARARCVDRNEHELFVGFADVSDRLSVERIRNLSEQAGYTLTPLVALWSDIRRSLNKASKHLSAASLRRAFEHEQKRKGSMNLEIDDAGSSWRVDGRGLERPTFSFLQAYPSASLSAFVHHLERQGSLSEEDGWKIIKTTHGFVIQHTLNAKDTQFTHPLTWSSTLKDFENEGGVAIFMQADKDVSIFHDKKGWKQASSSDHWREHPHLPHGYTLETPDQAERALHAALSGRPVVIMATTLPTAWLKKVAQADLPIFLFKRTPSSHGMAWQAWPYTSV